MNKIIIEIETLHRNIVIFQKNNRIYCLKVNRTIRARSNKNTLFIPWKESILSLSNLIAKSTDSAIRSTCQAYYYNLNPHIPFSSVARQKKYKHRSMLNLCFLGSQILYIYSWKLCILHNTISLEVYCLRAPEK